MQDGCAVPAVSTPAVNIGHVTLMAPNAIMVPRHIKLNRLFVKKSVCKGATAVISQPGNGSDASPGTSREFLQ